MKRLKHTGKKRKKNIGPTTRRKLKLSKRSKKKVDIKEEELEDRKLAIRQAYKLWKKGGRKAFKKLRRQFIEDKFKRCKISISKHLLSEGKVKWWGNEDPDSRPKRKRMANGDFTPDDWVWNPPLRNKQERTDWQVDTLKSLAKVTGPRVIKTKTKYEPPPDTKKNLVVDDEVRYYAFEAGVTKAFKNRDKAIKSIMMRGTVVTRFSLQKVGKIIQWLVRKEKKKIYIQPHAKVTSKGVKIIRREEIKYGKSED